jgi:hypothetical protein
MVKTARGGIRMSASWARWLALSGLLFGLVGVIVLFRYGMPFHVPTNGAVALLTEHTDKADVALEHRYMIYGYVGLACLVIGTVLQMLALLPAASD